jgi:hypothetical protein
MPSPSASSDVRLNPVLGTLFEIDLNYTLQQLIGYMVLPVIDVPLASSTFGRVPTEQLAKLSDVKRTSTGSYNRVNFTHTEDSYATREYGLEGVVDRRNSRIYSNFFDAKQATAGRVQLDLLVNAEKRVADAVFNTSTFTGASLTTGITNEWDDFTNATPIDDVIAASTKVRDNSGRYANCLAISEKVFNNLIRCSQIKEALQANGAGQTSRLSEMTPQIVASCFGKNWEILIGGAVYDSAKEGQSTTFSDVWSGEYAMVFRRAQTNNIEEPALGRTFHWGGDGSMPLGIAEDYPEDCVRSDVVRFRHEVQEKIIYPECGHLLSNITT